MTPSSPVRIVDKNGNLIDAANPLPVSSSGGGGGEVSGEVSIVPTSTEPYSTSTGNTSATSGQHAMVAAPGAGQSTFVRNIYLHNHDTAYVTGSIQWGSTDEINFQLDPESSGFISLESDTELVGEEALNIDIDSNNTVSWWVQYRTATTPS